MTRLANFAEAIVKLYSQMLTKIGMCRRVEKLRNDSEHRVGRGRGASPGTVLSLFGFPRRVHSAHAGDACLGRYYLRPPSGRGRPISHRTWISTDLNKHFEKVSVVNFDMAALSQMLTTASMNAPGLSQVSAFGTLLSLTFRRLPSNPF
jgi:hypothetical protein